MTVSPVRRGLPRRIATVSVHTSPLDQPGSGDAGGMNVYVVELSKRLAALGTEVEIFTRATTSGLPPRVELAPGVTVRHVTAGPFEGLGKVDLPAQMCAFTAGMMRAEAAADPGHYDLVHSHYWLSGQVGFLAADRWGVPLVHSMHTMAKVKNSLLAEGDEPEPEARVIGETQVVEAADRLIANTDEESSQLVDLYGADPARVTAIAPGVDLDVFRPTSRPSARARLGLAPDAVVLLFVGRIQPLKAPDVLVRAAARLLERDPSLRDRLVVAVVGDPSGSGTAHPEHLAELAGALHLSSIARFEPAMPQAQLVDWYAAADLTVVPSYNESFGLVAIESQACGTPVVAAGVGGLRTAVADGVSGVLVDGHDPDDYAEVVAKLLGAPRVRERLSAGAVAHAQQFGWAATAASVLDVYSQAIAERSPAARVAGLR